MNKIDRLYHLSNLLSFVAMAILLMDSLRAFEDWQWFNADWAFGIVAVIMCALVIWAKRLDVRRNNPNMIIQISKYAYFGSFGAFVIGWLFLEKYSTGQIIAFAVALALDLFSSISSAVVLSRMKKKIQ